VSVVLVWFVLFDLQCRTLL